MGRYPHKHVTPSEVRLHTTGTGLFIHKLALIYQLPHVRATSITWLGETKPWLNCQNTKGWPVNLDQNHLVRIPLLNNLSGAIAWSLDSLFFSSLCNCYEYMVGQQFTPLCVFMVRCFSENRSNPGTIRRFQAEFQRGASKILLNVEKYFAHGTSTKRNQGHSGWPRNANAPANMCAVRWSLIDNYKVSSRKNKMMNLSIVPSIEVHIKNLNGIHIPSKSIMPCRECTISVG